MTGNTFGRIAYLTGGVAVMCSLFSACGNNNQNIDRQEVVTRHNIELSSSMQYSPTQVGNGHFAMGMDVTGLQTFVPFSTLSDWGWHSFPLGEGVNPEDYDGVRLTTHGRTIPYMLRDNDHPEVCDYLRANPHRVNLGRLRLILRHADGRVASSEEEIAYARQTVDLWTGLVTSSFVFDGVSVAVEVSCHPERDIVAVSVKSELIREGRLGVAVCFPYADRREFNKYVGDYSDKTSHTTALEPLEGGYRISHNMDDLAYGTLLHFEGGTPVAVEDSSHSYSFVPDSGKGRLDFTCEFTREASPDPVSVSKVRKAYAGMWKQYWESGAAVDFGSCTDPRAFELERRVVLSQYLMRMNEAGNLPPQESGLVNNGWFGRYHWEMIWWHGAHYGMWNRFDCLDYLSIYGKFLQSASERAASEGRSGARWPKCTADINREWPCEAHALLVWQQPHPIYFAEMEYRANPSQEVLDKWKDVIIASADYMADLVFRDGERYVIGPPVVLVSENTDYMQSMNPSFELSYFRYGLRTAIAWAERLGLGDEVTAEWSEVLSELSPLPVEDGVYVSYEGMDDMWNKYNFEHPALTGVYGWLPGDGVDVDTFRRTFHKVLDTWHMEKVWGWDYPMLAMAAARIGEPSTAVDLLTTTAHKFGFDAHGLADTWPFPYFPANGGLLSAVAMMCGGWDGSEGDAPGFPQDGNWNVRYEGFNRMQ